MRKSTEIEHAPLTSINYEWKQHSKPVKKLHVDIFFDIHHYLPIGDSDPQESYQHEDIKREIQEAIASVPTGRIGSATAIQAVDELSTYFNRANEINESPDLRSTGVPNYFGLNLWLINQEESLLLPIPSCEYLSDLQTLFTWFDIGPMEDELFFYDDQYICRFFRLENRLHIYCEDVVYEKQVANISTPFDEVAMAVSLAKDRSQSVISALSGNLGIDKWTNRPPPEKTIPPVSADEEIDTRVNNDKSDGPVNSQPLSQINFLRLGFRLLLALGIFLILKECQFCSTKNYQSPPSQILDSNLDQRNNK